MTWLLLSMDEGLIGKYPSKRAALAANAPIWSTRRLKAGHYEILTGYSTDDHRSRGYLYSSQIAAERDGFAWVFGS